VEGTCVLAGVGRELERDSGSPVAGLLWFSECDKAD